MSQIEFKNIVKSYGATEVMHGVTFDIEQGEFVVFVGPSGCGKSTLLRMIAGLEEVTDGDIILGGKRINDEEPSDRGVAMVFQSYALYPHMSVADNMSFGLRMAHRPKDEIAQKVGHAAEILQLDQLLDRKPGQLSGGQRQRVAIGRAIVRNPEVFLFDEPLSNLDAELRVQMRVEIAQLHKKLANTMIYVTHDQTEAMTLADRIVVMRAGRIEQIGSPMELYEDPDNSFVAGFIGSPRMNFIEVDVLGADTISLGGETIKIPGLKQQLSKGQKVTLGIRPEHLDEADALHKIELDIDVIEQLGATSYVYGRLNTGETIITERRIPGNRSDTRLTARFKADVIKLFDTDGARIR